MRLYNSTSCTPVVGSNNHIQQKPKKWPPAQKVSYLPKRSASMVLPLREQLQQQQQQQQQQQCTPPPPPPPQATQNTFAPGFHFNVRDASALPRIHDHFPDEDENENVFRPGGGPGIRRSPSLGTAGSTSSPTTRSSSAVTSLPRSIRRMHSFGIAMSGPFAPNTPEHGGSGSSSSDGGPIQQHFWHSIEWSPRKQMVTRQQSWSSSSPSSSSTSKTEQENPFVVLPSKNKKRVISSPKNNQAKEGRAAAAASISPPPFKLQPKKKHDHQRVVARTAASASRKKENRSPPIRSTTEDFDGGEGADDYDFGPSRLVASMSLITEHGEIEAEVEGDEDTVLVGATPKLSPTESSSSDESSVCSAWLDFSLDGSENPFQEASSRSSSASITSSSNGTAGTLGTARTKKMKTTMSPKSCATSSNARFSPIHKAAPSRRRTPIMTVKPTPLLQRAKPSSHCLFPSQHSRQPVPRAVPEGETTHEVFSKKKESSSLSAFVKPTRRPTSPSPPLWTNINDPMTLPSKNEESCAAEMLSTSKKPDDSKDAAYSSMSSRPAISAPFLAPCSKDVEPIIFSRGGNTACGFNISKHIEEESKKSSPSSVKSSTSRRMDHLSKYSKRLKAGTPWEDVLSQMKDDEDVDAAIIELVTAARNHAGNR